MRRLIPALLALTALAGPASALEQVDCPDGVPAGGPTPYDEFRAGLRAVYQAICNNHPRPDEPAHPVWRGLPEGAPAMTRDAIAARVDECIGLSKPAAERSPDEARRLADLLAVTGVPERRMVAHLLFATNTSGDLVNKRLDGGNPFTNEGVRYAGSSDDAALNEAVPRFTADATAARRLRTDSELTGQIVLPTLTMHAIDDPTAFVSLEADYHDRVHAAGNGELLVQTFTRARTSIPSSRRRNMPRCSRRCWTG